MQSGYYSATGGMVSQFHKLNTTTNNLANMNTAGFKRDELIFGDYLRVSENKRDDLPLDNNTKDGARFYNRATARVPQVVDKFTDFSVGALKQSGNPLDLAITEKEMFFAIETPNGNKLTRNGAFTTNSEGLLVTKEGFSVLDRNMKPIEMDLSQNIKFDKNGEFVNGDNQGAIMVVQPENLKTLQKEGDGLFKLGDENEFIPVETSLSIRQGFVETSNVNGIIEMSHLIESNRMVGMYQKVMDTQMNELNRDAIDKIAATRA